MHRSSKTVDEVAPKLTMWRSWAAPDPGMGATVELLSGHTGGEGDLCAIGEALTSIGRTAQEAPPALDQIQPSSAHRDENLTYPRVSGEPLADGATGVTREVVGDEIEVAVGIVALDGAEQVQIPCGVARGSGLGEDVSITDAQRPIDPGLIVATAVDERRLNAMAIS